MANSHWLWRSEDPARGASEQVRLSELRILSRGFIVVDAIFSWNWLWTSHLFTETLSLEGGDLLNCETLCCQWRDILPSGTPRVELLS